MLHQCLLVAICDVETVWNLGHLGVMTISGEKGGCILTGGSDLDHAALQGQYRKMNGNKYKNILEK